MRQKTINLRNQGSFDKKKSIFFPDPKSHTQMGSLRAKNASEKFSSLGTFKLPLNMYHGTRISKEDHAILMSSAHELHQAAPA
jgi:hypothetical protein